MQSLAAEAGTRNLSGYLSKCEQPVLAAAHFLASQKLQPEEDSFANLCIRLDAIPQTDPRVIKAFADVIVQLHYVSSRWLILSASHPNGSLWSTIPTMNPARLAVMDLEIVL